MAQDLTTKTAQSLHEKWCEQMREKGFHGPDEKCSLKDTHQFTLVVPRMMCEEGKSRCPQFHADFVDWPDLPESRRQEYLATAKAVLPEIVGEVFDEAGKIARSQIDLAIEGAFGKQSALSKVVVNAIHEERNRCLEELRK